MNKECIIIGAGVSGLTCAYFLKKFCPSLEVRIAEKENKVGGLCRSIKDGNFIYDFGGHFIWDYKSSIKYDNEFKNFLDLLCKNSNIVWTPRNAVIYYDKNTMVKYPFQLNIEDLRRNHLKIFSDCLQNYAIKKNNKCFFKENNSNNYTLEVYSKNLFGDKITEIFIKPFSKKFWGSKYEISTGRSLKYIPDFSIEDIFKEKTLINIGYPKKGGIQAFTNCLYKEVMNLKVDIKLGNNVNFFTGSYRKNMSVVISSKFNEYLYDRNISNNLSFMSVRLLILGIKNKNQSKYNWTYYPNNDVDFYRINFLDSFDCNNYPKNTSLLFIEYNSEVKSNNCFENLRYLGILDNLDDIVYKKEIVVPCSYIVFDNREIKGKYIECFIKELEEKNIYMIGRYGKWDYMNLIDAMYDGYKTSKKIISSLI